MTVRVPPAAPTPRRRTSGCTCGPSSPPGDLGLIGRPRARSLITSTLSELRTLKRYDGFLYQWYDTTNGNVLSNPGALDCSETTPSQDNCWFLSAVDNGWYASGLIEVGEALPELRGLVDGLPAPDAGRRVVADVANAPSDAL